MLAEAMTNSPTNVIIPEDELDYDRIQKLSSRSTLFPTAREAFENVANHTEAALYDLPSRSAYASALELALRRDKDDLPDIDTRTEEESSESDFEIDLMQDHSKLQIGSDTDDAESQ